MQKSSSATTKVEQAHLWGCDSQLTCICDAVLICQLRSIKSYSFQIKSTQKYFADGFQRSWIQCKCKIKFKNDVRAISLARWPVVKMTLCRTLLWGLEAFLNTAPNFKIKKKSDISFYRPYNKVQNIHFLCSMWSIKELIFYFTRFTCNLAQADDFWVKVKMPRNKMA